MSFVPLNLAPEKKRLPKLVVKKSHQIKRSFRDTVGGLPNPRNSVIISHGTEVDDTMSQQNSEFDDNHHLPFDDYDQDIPSDTLLLIRNLQQPTNDDCWILPLTHKFTTTGKNGGIPVVLESLLTSRLEPSLVQTDWHNSLCQRFRKLIPVISNDMNCSTSLAVWVETQDYIQGVWDAVEVASSVVSTTDGRNLSMMDESHRKKRILFVMTWFVSQLQYWTTRKISQEDLQKAWKSSGMVSLDQAMDILIQLQVLLPIQSTMSCQIYILWLPCWGAALADLNKAKKSIMSCLCRSMYQERSITTFQSKNYGCGGLTGKIVLHILESEGKIKLIQRPAGIFVRRVSNNVGDK
jgi:hypothetical protein